MAERVWVTGSSGMVGRAVVDAFRRSRPEWTVLTSRRFEVDLCEDAQVRAFLHEQRPTVVVHAAGRVGGIAANIAAPAEFLTENMRMGVNVIEECRRMGVENLVNVSSSCMYPKDHVGLLTEELVLTGTLEPTNEGYALAKIAADRLCEYVATTEGLRYRTLVPSNLYGPGDHFDEHRGHLIANVIRKMHDAARSGASTVTVWGDGTARREFTYVDDVAKYIAHVSDPDVLAELPQRLNVGVGRDHSVAEFYELVASTVGWQGDFEFDLSRPSGMKQKLMDSSLARQHRWRPRTPIEVGLRRTYAYYLTTLNSE